MRFLTSLAVAALTLSVAAPLAAQAQSVDTAQPKPVHHTHKVSHKTHAKKHTAKVHKAAHKAHHVAKAPVKQS